MTLPPSGVPDVTVVIPCYNAERWVGRAIQSALDQEGVTVEVVVVDDGSTDASLDVILSFGDRIRCETGPNRGACAARNRGLALATAPYVMFLDADDFVEGPLLRGLVDALESERADLALGPCADASESGGRHLRTAPRTDGWREFVIDWLNGHFIPPCGILWRRQLIARIGGWRQDLLKNQDGEIVLRAALAGARLTSSRSGCAVYWHHPGATRISNTVSEAKLASSLTVLSEVVTQMGEVLATDVELRRALSRSSHTLERVAAEHRCEQVANHIATFRHRLSFPRYDGSLTHVMASRLLGLGVKQRLARRLRAATKRTPQLRRDRESSMFSNTPRPRRTLP